MTLHLPISEWYYHDLQYWGLDYPPLTAYVSWACGWVAHTIGSHFDGNHPPNTCAAAVADGEECSETNSVGVTSPGGGGLAELKDLVALRSSRGFEGQVGKMYMRITVLVLDICLYMSAVWTIAKRLVPTTSNEASMPEYFTTSSQQRTWLALTALCQPAIMLIDHGHFQYNTVSLGLALWSFHYMTLEDSRTTSFYGPVVGSLLFSLALNFKQMELYHAPAVFAYLLGRCFRRGTGRRTASSMQTTIKFFSLGAAVVSTFALLWAPFALTHRDSASSGANIDGVLQVLRRVFPFNRGIFEGKVCSNSPVAKRD